MTEGETPMDPVALGELAGRLRAIADQLGGVILFGPETRDRKALYQAATIIEQVGRSELRHKSEDGGT